MGDLVPEHAINYAEVFRRGGANCGDEDFALFKCPRCDTVYLLEYEVDTVYLDPDDLTKRVSVYSEPFACITCDKAIPINELWVGKQASHEYGVTWNELAKSGWQWVVTKENGSGGIDRGEITNVQ